jgi:hypothetical protein
MATGDNPIHVLFDEADDVTVKATGAVSAGHAVNVSADMEKAPTSFSAASPLTGGNLIQAAHASAGAKPFGVARTDIASGEVGGVKRSGIVAMVSSGAITAGAQVEVGAAGVAVVFGTGIPFGQAVTTAAGNIVYVALNV